MSDANRGKTSLHSTAANTTHNNHKGELTNARAKLDDLLQDMFRHNKESTSERDCIASLLDLPNQPSLPLDTKESEKRSLAQSRSPRKRKKKDTANNTNDTNTNNNMPQTPEAAKPHIHVIKLFDRSVDLAQFDEHTSLYTLCRSWMHNDPNNTTSDNDGFAKLELDTNDKTVSVNIGNNLPAMDESGNVHNLPRPIHLAEDHSALLIKAPDPKQWDTDQIGCNQQSIEDLRRDHITRWKRIRAKSRERLSKMQERYGETIRIINKLYRPRH